MSSQSYIFNPTERTLAAAGDGFSCPRLTTAGRTALSLTAGDKGMMVYDTTLTTLCIWTGAAWEFINDNSNAIVSVKDFGAKGDGVTDDTAAFTAAFASSKSIYVPTGNYKITSSITIPYQGNMFGDGSMLSVLKCDTAVFTGIFVKANGRTTVSKIGIEATGPKAGTGLRAADPLNEYSFTGFIYIANVRVSGLDKNLDINNIFLFKAEECEFVGGNYGVRVLPSYDGIGDNGYVTTLTFSKCLIANNSTYGYYQSSSVRSKSITIVDTGIENNVGATAQMYAAKVTSLICSNVYFENVPTSQAILLNDCDTNITGGYFNNTGGISISTFANSLTIVNVTGTTTTDIVYANGGIIQYLTIVNSTIPGTSTLSANKVSMVNSTVNGTYYGNRIINYTLSVTDDASNTTKVESINAYTRTVTATINAGTNAALISDQYIPSAWTSNFVVATASITNQYVPDLLLTVTTATTGNQVYICVIGRNVGLVPITLTSATLSILMVKGQGIAI